MLNTLMKFLNPKLKLKAKRGYQVTCKQIEKYKDYSKMSIPIQFIISRITFLKYPDHQQLELNFRSQGSSSKTQMMTQISMYHQNTSQINNSLLHQQNQSQLKSLIQLNLQNEPPQLIRKLLQQMVRNPALIQNAVNAKGQEEIQDCLTIKRVKSTMRRCPQIIMCHRANSRCKLITPMTGENMWVQKGRTQRLKERRQSRKRQSSGKKGQGKRKKRQEGPGGKKRQMRSKRQTGIQWVH
ncbi:hypothetical protein FGO68_gene3485 [Halteria grandinella]|uniref:Uncharacterized protein n=1 Tax=Halteria grandinella TaxID=5974 RepID=A0A8J8T313_HALGN|nr:hypothetical protein FGO68_gene3485 [Halteria grandinella]